MEAVKNAGDLFRIEENRYLVRYLVQRCASVNEGENLSLDIGNVELRIIPGDSVEIPHLTPAVDALVVFAGSNDLWDWIRNASCLKRACVANGGRVHGGFESDFMTVKDALLERLSGVRRVGIAGHSRAHPLACRLAEELHNSGVEVSFVITFGGPRWCDLDRRDRYNARRIPTYRFVVGWDAVPRWPKLGYKHVGKMICLSRAGKVLPRQQHPSWWTPWRFLWNAADEHIVANEYTRAVRDWQGKP
jgi:lipase (class 3)